MFIYSNILIVHLFEQSDIDIVWLFLLIEQSKLILIIYNLKKLKVSMVEDSGIEPLTSWIQIRRSPSWANPREKWWAEDDSNVRPHPYQGCALTTWATGPKHLWDTLNIKREMRTATLTNFWTKEILVFLKRR